MVYKDLPPGPYGVIYADPPWSYRDKLNHGKRGASHKYPTLTRQQLFDLPVGNIAATNCFLFMWWTGPLALDAIELVDAWGFELVNMTVFTWVKTTRKSLDPALWHQHNYIYPPKFFTGLGHWTRSNAENVLFARRGRPTRADKSVSQLVIAPVARHSEKPPEIRHRIDRLIGNTIPRVELFARERVTGWDAWGNEI